MITSTTTWIIEWMRCRKIEEGLTDVVIEAGWRANGTATVDTSTYQATAYGSVGFTAPDSEQFTPYQDLTKEQVLEWIWQRVDKPSVETGLNTQLETLINPPEVMLPLPWNNN